MNGKILFYDIETAPIQAYVWGLFDQNISIDQIIAATRILCIGWKWFGVKGTHYADERGGQKPMLEAFHAAFCEADAVVTYNGDKFDIPKTLGQFVLHGLPPPPPVTSIDLLKTVKRLGLDSNKLAYVGPYYGIGEKVKHEGFPLWVKCMQGDGPAWGRMERYNRRDVRLMEPLYELLRPFIQNHPYIGQSKGLCPACGSANVQKRGERRTRMFFIERLACQSCGAWTDGSRRKAA